MTAQIANGGYKIYPQIIADSEIKDQQMINILNYIKIQKI